MVVKLKQEKHKSSPRFARLPAKTTVLRGEHGKWLKGTPSPNPLGAMCVPAVRQLEEAIRRVQSKAGIDLMDWLVHRAYKDDRVLCAVIDRLLPRLASVNVLTGAAGAGDVQSVRTAILQEIRRYKNGSHTGD